jgi:hypothetical protein
VPPGNVGIDEHALDCAVVKILAGPSGDRKRGTGTLVAPGLVLTALHVVADRFQESPTFAPAGTIDLVFVKKGIAAKATVVEGCFDPDADWVLLQLDHDVDVVPAPLGTLRSGEIGEKVAARTFGFPAENSKVGLAYHGYVADTDTTYAGTGKGPRRPLEAAAIQLFVESAKENDIAGLSGGPCFVGGALVGVIRSTLTDQDELSKGHLYACPIASILDTIGERLPLLDPYRGLPGLPPRPLPGRFFRYLERYTEADAEIFFGRGRELHELYRFLLSEDAPPIVLFFGQTGVGKSSVLDAGLTPRLRLHREPLYVRRDAAQGLVHSLTAALAGAPGAAVSRDANAPSRRWREVEKALGKPLIVVLDQVEEAYTRSNERQGPLPDSLAPGQDPGDAELGELAAHLATVFGEAGARPRGRLVLSFRKEWLAEISARLEDRGLSFSRILLERLDDDGIQEIVLGLQRTPRIQAKWRASVDPDLPLIVSNGLLSDPGSPVAPTLQIIMTRMFEAADQTSPGAPALTVEVYNALERFGLLFKAFVPQQIQLLEKTHRAAVDSGLIDDILDYHTTDAETAAAKDLDDLLQRYALGPPDPPRSAAEIVSILEALKRVNLLTESVGGSGQSQTRLAHDTLAPVIRDRFRRSAHPGQRARRLLEARMADWAAPAAGRPLDEGDLALVKAGRAGMRALTGDERHVLDASDLAARKAKRRRRSTTFATWFGVVLVGSIVYVNYDQTKQMEAQKVAQGRVEALASVEQLLVRAEKATSPLEALPLLCRAVELLPEDDPRLDSLVARTIQVAVDAPIVSADLLASGELAGHATGVRRILATDLSADGHEALAQLADGAIWIIPVDAAAVLSGRVLGPAQTLDLEGKHFNAPRLSPDGKWVSAMEQGSDQLAIWDAGSRSGPRMLAMAHGDSTRRAYWSASSRAIRIGAADDMLLLGGDVGRTGARLDREWVAVGPADLRAAAAARSSAPTPIDFCLDTTSPGGAYAAKIREVRGAADRYLLEVTAAGSDKPAWSATVFSAQTKPCVRDVDEGGQRVLVGRFNQSATSFADFTREPIVVVRPTEHPIYLQETGFFASDDHDHLACAHGLEPSGLPRFTRPASGPGAGLVASCTGREYRTFWFDAARWPSFRPVRTVDLRAHRPVLETGLVVGISEVGQLQIFSARSASIDHQLPADAGPARAAANLDAAWSTADGRYKLRFDKTTDLSGQPPSLLLQSAADDSVLPPLRMSTSVGHALLQTLLATAPVTSAGGTPSGDVYLTMAPSPDSLVDIRTRGGVTSARVGTPRVAPLAEQEGGLAAAIALQKGTNPDLLTTPLVFSAQAAEGPGAFCISRALGPRPRSDSEPRTELARPLLAYVSASRVGGSRPTAPWVPVIVEDLASGTTLGTFYSTAVRSMRFSPDCESLSVGGEDGVERSWFVMKHWNGKKPDWISSLGLLILGTSLDRGGGREATIAAPTFDPATRAMLFQSVRDAKGAGDLAAAYVWRHWFGPDAP